MFISNRKATFLDKIPLINKIQNALSLQLTQLNSECRILREDHL
jgi:hypothetical protein